MDKINYKMIQLARESRGKNQTELAEIIDIPQGNLSRMERGEVGVKEEILEKMSVALQYPKTFFTQQNEIYPPNIHFRKRATLDQKTLLKADAIMNIYRFNIQEMLRSLDLSNRNTPIISEQYDTPEKVAIFLRSYWNVPKGSINDLSKLIEDNGIIVIQIDFETDKIDGRSVMTDTGHAIIFVNKNSSGDRQRLTIAHELGHIIMHVNTIPAFARDEEDEAFRFASEFLMPYSESRYDFTGRLTLEKLADLKRVWKVSMQSILKRAQQLEIIEYNRARYLWSQFNTLGIRRKEPIEIPQEVPTLASRMVNMFLTQLDYTKEDLAGIFRIHLKEVEERYLSPKTNKLRVA